MGDISKKMTEIHPIYYDCIGCFLIPHSLMDPQNGELYEYEKLKQEGVLEKAGQV